MRSLLPLLLLLWSQSCTGEALPDFDCDQSTDYCIFAHLNGSQSQTNALPAMETGLSVKMKSHETHNVIAVDCPAGCSELTCNITFQNRTLDDGAITLSVLVWRTNISDGVSAYLTRSRSRQQGVGSYFEKKLYGKSGLLIEMSKSLVKEFKKNTFTVDINGYFLDNGDGKRTWPFHLKSAKAELLFSSNDPDSAKSGSNTVPVVIISVCAVLILLLIVIIVVSCFGIRREITLRSSTRGTSTASQ